MEDTIRTTKHARRRLKERAKLPPRSAARQAVKAFTEGKTPDDPEVSPALRARIEKFMARSWAETGEQRVYRLYRGCLFVFADNGALITVLPHYDETPFGLRKHRWDGTTWSRGRRVRCREGKRPRIDFVDEDEDAGGS